MPRAGSCGMSDQGLAFGGSPMPRVGSFSLCACRSRTQRRRVIQMTSLRFARSTSVMNREQLHCTRKHSLLVARPRGLAHLRCVCHDVAVVAGLPLVIPPGYKRGLRGYARRVLYYGVIGAPWAYPGHRLLGRSTPGLLSLACCCNSWRH